MATPDPKTRKSKPTKDVGKNAGLSLTGGGGLVKHDQGLESIERSVQIGKAIVERLTGEEISPETIESVKQRQLAKRTQNKEADQR